MPKRKNIRLKDYNYSQSGSYFITICTKNRKHIFGDIVDGKMELNEYGKIVYDEMLKTIEKRYYVFFDNFIIMPNHIHILISLSNVNIDNDADTARLVPTAEQFGKPTRNSIPTVIRSLKSAVTNEIHKNVGTRRAVSVESPEMYEIWQERFHDRIVRNENEYQRIWQYIDENPLKWADDKYYGGFDSAEKC